MTLCERGCVRVRVCVRVRASCFSQDSVLSSFIVSRAVLCCKLLCKQHPISLRCLSVSSLWISVS